MALRGKYTLKRPEKYLGNPKSVIFRSKWERETFKFLEGNPQVVKWASEEIKIPYLDPWNKPHKYYPDLYFELRNGKKYMVEIKPASQCRPPTTSNHRRFIKEQIRYQINQNKWSAAKDWCARHGLEWRVWTERDLNKTLGLKI